MIKTTVQRDDPELAVLLMLALGFLLARIRAGSFALGNLVDTLLARRSSAITSGPGRQQAAGPR